MKHLEDYTELDKWCDDNAINGDSCFLGEYFINVETLSPKFVEMQQRIDELEKEKYNSIEAWNSKLEKLTTENAELKQLIAIDRVLTCGPLFEVCKESLAQHDKEVASKAIDDACEYAFAKFPNGFLHSMAEFKKQLQEQE